MKIQDFEWVANHATKEIVIGVYRNSVGTSYFVAGVNITQSYQAYCGCTYAGNPGMKPIATRYGGVWTWHI